MGKLGVASTMRRIELKEYSSHSTALTLDKQQLRALIDAHIEVTPSPEDGRTYNLKPSSYIGAVNVGDLAVVVRPKIPIDRVMFLIAYSMDPKNWRRDSVNLTRDEDVLEAITLAFAHRTRQAIRRGLLQGYRREEDALNTVRGRIRFGDQIRRRFDIPLPVEVAFDEFTEDIEENRLLKTAIQLLGHTFIRSKAARREVRRLRPAFTTVGLGSYRRGTIPEVDYTRLNEHYRPAVELARLIVESSSLELFHGKVTGAAFLIDMNKVFERFLYVALGEALRIPEHQWKSGARLTLDDDDRISMNPDLSWWPTGPTNAGGRPIFVGDAKYKRLQSQEFKHADIYQMLAYCTAADLATGLLIYAAGEHEPCEYRIRHVHTMIEVAPLNLRGTPEAILKEVRRLATIVQKQMNANTAAEPSGLAVTVAPTKTAPSSRPTAAYGAPA